MRFTDVRVPADALLGPEGDAFATLFSLPMRKVEDAISAANKAGAYCFQINQLGREVAACDLEKETLAELGSLAAARDGLSALSYRAVELLIWTLWAMPKRLKRRQRPRAIGSRACSSGSRRLPNGRA